jgi:hypothetical protein
MSYRPYAAIIAEANAGSGAVRYTLTNGSGSPIGQYVPVSVNSNGEFKACSPSNESDSIRFVGLTEASSLNTQDADVMGIGRLVNINSLGFDLGDLIYVSKSGGLTNEPPEIDENGFEAGDFVLYVGKIVKNQTNPSEKDLLVSAKLIGQL